MKAVWVSAFAPFDTIPVMEVASPQPAAGEVVIDVHAAEANYPDILVIEGKYQIKPPLPFSPGKCAAGIVSAVGTGVTSLKIGDRVAAQTEYGAFAEQLKVRAETCFAMPDTMPFDKAAALGLVYQTAWIALEDRAHFKRGEIVLVLGGSGGIGVASIQLAKALGASIVIAGIIGEGNEAVARQAGADHVVDLGEDNLRDRLREHIQTMTNGHGVDVVIDNVGSRVFTPSFKSMAVGGRYAFVGQLFREEISINPARIFFKRARFIGVGSCRRDQLEDAVALVAAGKVRPRVAKVLPLEQAAEAHAMVEGGDVVGRVVLKP